MLQIKINDSILCDSRILGFLEGKNRIEIRTSIVDPDTEGDPTIEKIETYFDKDASEIFKDCTGFEFVSGTHPRECASIGFNANGDDDIETIPFDFNGHLYFDGKNKRLIYIGSKVLADENNNCQYIWEVKKVK